MMCTQFSTRINVLGHAQQGGPPSPFDRNMATKLAAHAADRLIDDMVNGTVLSDDEGADLRVETTHMATCCLLGMQGRQLAYTPVETLRGCTDFAHRLPKEQWWLKLRPLLRILAKHDSTYQQETIGLKDEDDTDSEM